MKGPAVTTGQAVTIRSPHNLALKQLALVEPFSFKVEVDDGGEGENCGGGCPRDVPGLSRGLMF